MLESMKEFFSKKIIAVKRRRAVHEAARFTSSQTPKLLDAYAAFARAQQSGVPRQPFKGWDIWMLLERFQPNKIVELGSGTTSAVFSLWSRTHGADYVCFEHHADWAKVTDHCLREASLIEGESPIRVVEMQQREDGAAVGFSQPLPTDADFVYVDGPPCTLSDGRKVPNDDICRAFAKGVTPQTIVIDGRLQTVDFIREHLEGRRYGFEPGYVYCLRRHLWNESLKAREHTIFFKQ